MSTATNRRPPGKPSLPFPSAATAACTLLLALGGLLSPAVGAMESTMAATIGMHEQPIHDAARLGKREDVAKLLKQNPKVKDARNPIGMTPLHHAAQNSDPGPLTALIEAGAAVNAIDQDGQTPLHIAAFNNRSQNATLLLRAGADPSIKSAAGRDVTSLARKAKADEAAGVISLWILKGCKPKKPDC